MFKLLGLSNIALLLATTLAATQPICLPKSVFVKNQDGEFPLMDLGYVKDALTLCAYATTPAIILGPDKRLGCWTVDPSTGALGASTTTAIPGRGRRVAVGAKNCIDGYCIPPIKPDTKLIFATSTDGAHAAIVTSGSDSEGDAIYIFETGTKKKTVEIPLVKPDAPDNTNVSNAPVDLLYNGDTLFVIGSDAGPAIGATAFKENGDRGGTVMGDDDDPVNLFRGGYGILRRDQVGFADTGLQNMTTVTGANGGKQSSKRTVSYAPCKESEFEAWTRAEDGPKGACKRVLDAKYMPYTQMSPALLPSGDIITTLTGPAHGNIAVLRQAGLTELRRMKLARCQ
jgi:hypothetical protein